MSVKHPQGAPKTMKKAKFNKDKGTKGVKQQQRGVSCALKVCECEWLANQVVNRLAKQDRYEISMEALVYGGLSAWNTKAPFW